jgi:shikimate dehydrogenase
MVTLIQIYLYKNLTIMINKTKLNLIYGYQAAQINLYSIFRVFAKRLNIEDDMIFAERSISPDKLTDAIKAIKILDINSLGIVSPHKTEVIDYLDDVDSAAMIIESVDTVINKGGILSGFNTDWLGILFSLADSQKVVIKNIHHIPRFLEGKKIGLVGLGFSTRAFIYAAICAGAEVMLYSKSQKEATDIIEYFKELMPLASLKFVDRKMINTICACDIIVNCSLSKNQNEIAPFDLSILTKNHTILDFADMDNNTLLVKDSSAKGCTVISKSSVINYQNKFQFELMTGKKID